MKDKTVISRRIFTKKLIGGGASLGTALVLPFMLKSPNPAPSKVVILRSDRLKRINDDINREVAGKFLNESIKRITGLPSVISAWKSLFAANEKVGIKLSCLPGSKLSSSKGLVGAIVDGLNLAGVKAKNIHIWERSNRELERAGFKTTTRGVRVFGTDALRGGGYSTAIEYAGSVGTCFSLILQHVDAIINVPVLKDHDIAGISNGMKNFFGAIYNPNKFHDNNCNPYIADLCTHRFIKKKLRLIVCDASRIQVHNGPAFYPQYAWEYGGLLVSHDPVALDYTGWQIIEKRRKELKMKSLKESGRDPKYIKTAEKLKLGNADERFINKIKL